jgi:hypothetical protein
MLEFIYSNLQAINARFYMVFVPLSTEQLKRGVMSDTLEKMQVVSLPTLLCFDSNDILQGARDICNFLVGSFDPKTSKQPKSKYTNRNISRMLESTEQSKMFDNDNDDNIDMTEQLYRQENYKSAKGPHTSDLHDEGALHEAMSQHLAIGGDENENDNNEMEKVKMAASGANGVADEKFARIISKAKVVNPNSGRIESFGNVNTKRKMKKESSYNDAMRGNGRVTEGRGTKKQSNIISGPQNMNTTTAYRGNESFRDASLGKPGVTNPLAPVASVATERYMDNDQEDVEKAYDRLAGNDTKSVMEKRKKSAAILSKLTMTGGRRNRITDPDEAMRKAMQSSA